MFPIFKMTTSDQKSKWCPGWLQGTILKYKDSCLSMRLPPPYDENHEIADANKTVKTPPSNISCRLHWDGVTHPSAKGAVWMQPSKLLNVN